MKFKQSVLGLALAGALTLCPAAAWAQQHPIEPYYLAPKLLYSSQSMDDFSSKGRYGGKFDHSTGTYKGKDSSDNAFGGGLAIGYDFGVYGSTPIRLELEYLYRGQTKGSYGDKLTRDDDNGDHWSTAIAGSRHTFQANIHTVFANAYLDFPNDSNFTPYIGGGIGGAYVDAKTTIRQTAVLGYEGYYTNPTVNNDYSYVTPAFSHKYSGQQNSWNMAWNLGAGFAYQVSDNIALDFNYRYSDFGEADFGTQGYYITGPVVNPDWKVGDPDIEKNLYGQKLGNYSGKSKVNLTSHEFILGLRFTGY